jgi:hypothetical protein
MKAVQRVSCAWCLAKLGVQPCDPDDVDTTAYRRCPQCAGHGPAAFRPLAGGRRGRPRR